MIIKGITVGLLQENCYILGCEKTQRGVIVDPGDNASMILNLVAQMELTIEKIINTHAHMDHVLAVNEVKAALDLPFHLHQDELPILHDVPERALLWLNMEVEPVVEPDAYLTHGQTITFGEESLEVRFTPGHAPGHVIFVDHKSRQIIAGDTLFSGSVGRYDLPLADGPTLFRSIQEQIFTLPDDYRVHPGHGQPTTVGIERIHNPFVGQNR